MSNEYVKKYGIGRIGLELPSSEYAHELPLLSFSDFHGGIDLSLVFNSSLMSEGANTFNISAGYKLNLQKRLILSGDAPTAFVGETGKSIPILSGGTLYVVSDGSGRTILKTGNTYRLEYPDSTREYYDMLGRIYSAYDKYGRKVLTYNYDSSGLLSSVVYREERTITLAYNSSSCLTSISYGGKAVNFTYNSSGITVKHYNGVEFTSVPSSDSLAVYSADAGASYTSNYVRKITCTRVNNTVTVEESTNGGEPKRAVYTLLNVKDGKATAVSITDKNGVTNRIQYEGDEPRYSYEVMDTDDDDKSFFSSGTGQVYKGTVYIGTDGAGGSQGIDDRIKMTATGGNYAYKWTPGAASESMYGDFIISGWVYPAANITYTLSINTGEEKTYELKNLTPDIWNYFSVKAYIRNPHEITAKVIGRGLATICADMRITFEYGKIYSNTELNYFALNKDVLIKKTSGGGLGEIIPIDDSLNFYNESTLISEKISAKDVLTYKINQKKGGTKNVIYLNDCKKIKSNVGTLKVEYGDAKESVENFAVGKYSVYCGKARLVMTDFETDSDENTYLVSKSYVKSGESSSSDFTQVGIEKYDGNLDPISKVSNGITTVYTRDRDLVLSEETDGLKKSVTYGDNTVRVKQSFNGELLGEALYEFNEIWGNLFSVTMPDGSTLTDELDGDGTNITGRTFSDILTHSFGYSEGNLTSVSNGTLAYGFEYSDDKLTKVTKNNSSVTECESTDTSDTVYYPSKSNKLYTVPSEYDKYGRVVKIDGVLENIYDVNPTYAGSSYGKTGYDSSSAKVAEIVDKLTGNTTKLGYAGGALSAAGTFNSEGELMREEKFSYDGEGRLISHTLDYATAGESSFGDDISYIDNLGTASDGKISSYSYKIDGTEAVKTTNTYDGSGRIAKKTGQLGSYTYSKEFTYDKGRISEIKDTKNNGSSIGDVTYDYDPLGRIAEEINDSSVSCPTSYEYDSLGRLIRENNKSLDKTYFYEYNEIGNVVSVGERSYTTVANPSGTSSRSFTCGDSEHPDRLTSFGGKSISYNSTGCISSYGAWSYSWSKGRLSGMSSGDFSTGIDSYSYSYDAYGRRIKSSYTHFSGSSPLSQVYTGQVTKKTKTFDYDLSGRLVYETINETQYGVGDVSMSFRYLYDENEIIGAEFRNGASKNTYFYRKNLQGDVIGIYDTSGSKVAGYSYDAWGNCSVESTTNYTLANRNPIRYRGYYYDTDLKLYYLNSRYYNPEWRRFISPDSTEYLDPENPNGLNLYAYCNNDPVNYKDPSGHLAEWAEWLIGGAVIGLVALGAIFLPGAAGVIMGAAFYGAVTSAVGGAVLGGLIGGITGGWEGAWDGASNGFMWGAISGAVSGALTAGINIATGHLKIVGSAQKTGSLFHQFASNVQAGKMSLAVGRYSEIHLNRSKGLGIRGFRPDVTGITKKGLRVVEVVSTSQTYSGQVAKIGRMMGKYSHITNGITLDALHLITNWFIF